MNRIEDERVLFYLRHQERIDEWAALAKEASESAHQFLCSCQDDIAGLAREFGPDVRSYVSLEESLHPKIFLYRSAWLLDRESPRTAIGLEWYRPRLSFSGRAKSAYSGVWVDYRGQGGPTLHGAMLRAFKEAGLVKEHRLETQSDWWPTYRWEPAQGEYWTDLAPYRTQLIDSVRFFWKTFEPIVREHAG